MKSRFPLFLLVCGILLPDNVDADDGVSPSTLLAAAGVRGGLVVCIGCDEPGYLVSLRSGGSFVVHALDTDADKVAAARQSLHEMGVYGPVSVQQWDAPCLPYVDNLVNAIVIRDAGCEIQDGEIERVLAPRGVAIGPDGAPQLPQPVTRIGDAHIAFTKPVPAEIDEWTHYLHGPDNNALAEDTLVGPPRHLQWRSEPMWGRHHHSEKGTNPTVRTVVSSNGRLFCLIDETRSSNMSIPSQWTIVARDAFSGVLLWRRPVRVEAFPKRLEQVWRQLIAEGDRVYAVLGVGQPLSELNAVTSDVIKTFPGSEGLSEVIKHHDLLIVLNDDNRIAAFDAPTSEKQWAWNPPENDAVIRGAFAAANDKVFVKTTEALCCLAADTGDTTWRIPLPGPEKKSKLNFPHEKLLVSDGVVLCSYAGKDPASLKRDVFKYLGSHPRVHEYGGKLGAFSAADGSQLWQTDYFPNLESAPGEIYVHDGQVWLGPAFDEPRDLQTGKILKTRPVIERLWTDGHHYRCYPGKATSRFILTAKRGIELIDMTGENHSRNNWVRATCRVGFTPCNGLLYATPHSCGCYQEAKLFGFYALAAESEGRRAEGRKRRKTNDERLESGPAYGELGARNSERGAADAPTETSLRTPRSALRALAIPHSAFRFPHSKGWWTFRGGNDRGASTAAEMSADLKVAWTTNLGGKLSAATVADGRVFVAQVDAHTLHAMDFDNGDRLWSFTTGGRVDSPPTLIAGLVLFGSHDGYVYCLRASDGQLAWRFLAAPRALNAVAFDQPESVWPVHGSVLVHEGIAYATAGRSSYLDGGIMLYGLDPRTGRVVAERRIQSEHVGITEPPVDAEKFAIKNRQNWPDYKTKTAADRSDSFAMRGATTDILVADADSIYLRHMRLDRDLKDLHTNRPHLFSTASLLDDWEHNRSYWVLGTGNFYNTPVAYPWILRRDIQVPFGLLLAFDEQTVWGVHRAKGYTAFAMSRPDPADQESGFPDFQARTTDKKVDVAAWTAPLGIRPRAMLRAGELLFFGGLPVEGPTGGTEDKRGAVQILSCRDGETIRTVNISSPPLWDSMATAQSKLVIPCADGSLLCLAPR